MPAMNDAWIITQCIPPTHLISVGDELAWSGITHDPADLDRMVRMGQASLVKPEQIGAEIDWQPMIEGSFVQPVRYVNIETGEPVYIDVPEGEEPPAGIRRAISFGVSSFGYDVRLASDPEHIKVFTNVHVPEIDPKNMRAENFGSPMIRTDEKGARYVLIPAHSYIQGPTMEYFRIPRDILVIVLGKSTYARSALVCNVTPIEPEFEGKLTLQITNVTNKHLRVYLDEGVAKLVFSTTDL